MLSTEASRVDVAGPLVPYAAGFCEVLNAQGFTESSAAAQMRLMAHVSRWLADQGLTAGALTLERIDQFLEARFEQGYTRRLTTRALIPLLGHLREVGVAPLVAPVAVLTADEQLVDMYRSYLLVERGLVAGTVRLYAGVASRFLARRVRPDDGVDVLEPGDVTLFVVRESRRHSVASAKNLVTGLRSFLRFLFAQGLNSRPLDEAVPGVAPAVGEHR